MSKTYELAVLLRGDDQLSGKLNKTLAALRELQKLSRGGIGVPKSSGGSGNETVKEVRALRELQKLRGDTARAAQAEGRTKTDSVTRSLAALRQETKLRQDNVRLRRRIEDATEPTAAQDRRLASPSRW